MITIVIPTLNEENYLLSLVNNLLKNKEVISEIYICDAGSTDGTIAIIQKLVNENNCVYYFENKRKFVSYAFNEIYPKSKGKYMALLGSHALYPERYLIDGVSYLESGEADVVGGPLNQKGQGDTGTAIALAMSSKFGVGDTEFRTSKKKQYVDSVAFAIYRKEIFDKIGVLNEQLKRNQDDELHYRIKANGYKILMVLEMECTYYVRSSFQKLWNQYYEYGLYKPLVLKMVSEGTRLRHLIPSLFVLYLFGIPFMFLLFNWIALLPLALYFVLAFYIAFKSSKNVSIICKVVYSILILHISYGLGFILGITKSSN